MLGEVRDDPADQRRGAGDRQAAQPVEDALVRSVLSAIAVYIVVNSAFWTMIPGSAYFRYVLRRRTGHLAAEHVT